MTVTGPGDGPIARRSLIERGRTLLEDERVRFVLVGGINTLIGLVVFIVVDRTFGVFVDSVAHQVIGSIATLAVSHVVSVIIAFVLHRRLVFRARGHLWLDFIRFQGVYVITFSVNVVVLPVLVSVGVPRIAAQVAIVAVMTVASYFGHRYFSFRRRPEQTPDNAGLDPHIL